MKKIICTVTNDLTYDRRMHRICSSLQENGYEVTLVGRQLRDSKPLTAMPFGQHRLRCFFHKGKFFYIEYNIRLFFWLLFAKFDAVCSVDLDTILPGFYVARFKNKICVYDAHEYFTEVPEVVQRKLTKKIWEWVAKLTIPKIKYAYTVSHSLATALTERYDTSFKVVRNVPFSYQPVSDFELQEIVKKYQLPAQHRKTILLYQGALNEGRGIETLFAALPQLENVELWLAGEGDLSAPLRQMAQTSLLMDKVRFLGFVPPYDLIRLTRLVDIGFNLLENKGLSYYYSLANKTFDYVQAGVPAVHMAFPEYVYLNGKHEISALVPDLVLSNVVPVIQRLIEDKAYYQKLVKNCAIAKSEWTWEAEEAALLAVYQAAFRKN